VKIAFFAEGYDPFINGVVTSLKTLQSVLAQRGHEVIIFAPAYPGHEDSNSKVVRLPSVKWSKICYPCLSPLAWRKDVVAAEGFDLVHSHQPFTMSRLAVHLARKHRLPLVYSFHTMLNEFTQYMPRLDGVGKRFLTWAFLRHCAEADRVTSATQIVREFLQEQGVETPITVVPEGVSLLHPTSDARDRVRRHLGVSCDTPLLFYAGRLGNEKQPDFLLRSVAYLRKTHDFHLALAGGGPMERELHSLAAQLGIADRVIFCGWIPHEQIADYYAAADVFVFPSTGDAMGMVLVEAMSLGVPCVAVDKFGPRELVIDGVTGLLVPFSEQAFAGAVGHLLDNPPLCRRMGQAARQRARDFAPDVVADKLCGVYQEVLEQHSSGFAPVAVPPPSSHSRRLGDLCRRLLGRGSAIERRAEKP